jgi:hypothetical protein
VPVGCTLAEEDESYDAALLQQYRSALPTTERLASGVPTPGNQSGALALEADSEIARLAIEAAVNVNVPAVQMVLVLKIITDLPPTLYDSETREFVWGPWPSDDGVGNVVAYIRENDAGDDFQYSYAFARLMDQDIATAEPVIAGGASPDPDDPDLGVGVTLWDMQMNNAFDAANDPDFDPDAPRDQGRVAMLYGAGSEGGEDYTFNVAVLRDFVAEDAEPGAQPADAEIFYGRTRVDGVPLNFLDWVIEGDVCDATVDSCFENDAVDDADETFAFSAAFLGTAGRGEAQISGGDLTSELALVECWDTMLETTYLSVDDGTTSITEGSCGGNEDVTLAESGVPTLDQIDADLMDALDCVASNGFRACE